MDVLILLGLTALGCLKAPLGVVFLGAAVLTAMSSWRKFEIARAYPDAGSGRLLAVALFLSFANNTVFSLLSYLLGHAVSQLI